MRKTEKTKVKRRPDGKFDKGHQPSTMFKKGNPGGPGRPKDWTKYAQQEISRIEGLEPDSDEYLRAMARLQWKYAKEGKYEALRDLVDRQFGRVADHTVILQKVETEVVHLVSGAFIKAFLVGGYTKEQANKVIKDAQRFIRADSESSRGDRVTGGAVISDEPG